MCSGRFATWHRKCHVRQSDPVWLRVEMCLFIYADVIIIYMHSWFTCWWFTLVRISLFDSLHHLPSVNTSLQEISWELCERLWNSVRMGLKDLSQMWPPQQQNEECDFNDRSLGLIRCRQAMGTFWRRHRRCWCLWLVHRTERGIIHKKIKQISPQSSATGFMSRKFLDIFLWDEVSLKWRVRWS